MKTLEAEKFKNDIIVIKGPFAYLAFSLSFQDISVPHLHRERVIHEKLRDFGFSLSLLVIDSGPWEKSFNFSVSQFPRRL